MCNPRLINCEISYPFPGCTMYGCCDQNPRLIPAVGKAHTYHPSIPIIAHKKMTNVTTPVPHNEVRKSVIYNTIDRIHHKPRSHQSYDPMEDFLNERSTTSFEDVSRSIRANTAALLKKVHTPVPRAVRPSSISHDYNHIETPISERISSDEYIWHLLRPLPGKQHSGIDVGYYPETSTHVPLGKTHLACLSYAGNHPISKRKHLVLGPEDDYRNVRNDVELLSHYSRMRNAASDPHEHGHSNVHAGTSNGDVGKTRTYTAHTPYTAEKVMTNGSADHHKDDDEVDTSCVRKSFSKKRPSMDEERQAEKERLAQEERQAEEDEKRQAEIRRREKQKRWEEEEHEAEEKKRAEESRRRREEEEEKREAQRHAEEERKAEARRKAEEERYAEEQRLAEEAARKAEARRKTEEERYAEEERLAEEERKAEARRKAEEERYAEEERLAAEKRRIEEEEERAAAEFERLAEEERLEEERRAEEKRIEEERLAEEKRLEAKRHAEEERLAEARRKAEEERYAEEERLAKEKKRAEEERLAKEQHQAEDEEIDEFEKLAADEEQSEEQRLLEEKLIEEYHREQERKRELEQQYAEQQQRVTKERLAEEQKLLRDKLLKIQQEQQKEDSTEDDNDWVPQEYTRCNNIPKLGTRGSADAENAYEMSISGSMRKDDGSQESYEKKVTVTSKTSYSVKKYEGDENEETEEEDANSEISENDDAGVEIEELEDDNGNKGKAKSASESEEEESEEEEEE